MRIFKWIKPLRFFIALCFVNMLLSFLLEPAKGSSDTMWTEFYQEEEIDFAFVGSSFCSTAFVPYVVDEIMGVNSFNMGTPLQAIGQTVSAVETLLEEHNVDTIVLGTGFFVLQYETLDEAELTFEKARARKKSGLDAMEDTLAYIFDENVRDTEKSINYFFPWTYNRQKITSEYIRNNVRDKIANIKAEFSQSGDNKPKQESAKGLRPGAGVVDYGTAWEINSYWYYDQVFLEDKVEEFEEILQLCKENGVDIVVINTPHPTFDVVSCHQTYETSENEMRAICEKYDVDYYNFSLAKPELFDSVPEYYSDFEHLNLEGAEVFSESLCKLLKGRDAGEDVMTYFYSVEEYYELHSDLLEEWKSVQTPK